MVVIELPPRDSLNGLKKLGCTFQQQAAFQASSVCGDVKASLPVDTREKVHLKVHLLNGTVVSIEKYKKRYVKPFVSDGDNSEPLCFPSCFRQILFPVIAD